MFMYLLSNFISCICVLLSVAFFTLMERKIMGITHFRKGPNKVFILGITQPISDAMKLLTKENSKISSNMNTLSFLGPTISMILFFLCWMNYTPLFNVNSNNFKILLIFSIMSLSVYPFILCSWSSNSKYALLGGNRGISQTISYEVCLIMIILIPFFMMKSYSIESLSCITKFLWIMMWSPLMFLSWVTIMLAETNRTPFDTSEGESEIVSGFNIEYSGGLFTFIFISEYGMIMFISFMTSLIFLGGSTLMKIMIMCVLFVWARSSFPRVRYDMLMMLCWKMILPMIISYLMLSYSLI